MNHSDIANYEAKEIFEFCLTLWVTTLLKYSIRYIDIMVGVDDRCSRFPAGLRASTAVAQRLQCLPQVQSPLHGDAQSQRMAAHSAGERYAILNILSCYPSTNSCVGQLKRKSLITCFTLANRPPACTTDRYVQTICCMPVMTQSAVQGRI